MNIWLRKQRAVACFCCLLFAKCTCISQRTAPRQILPSYSISVTNTYRRTLIVLRASLFSWLRGSSCCNSNDWLGVKHEVTGCNSNDWLGVKHEVTCCNSNGWLGVKHEVTGCNSNDWLGVKHEVTCCNSNGWLGVKHEVTCCNSNSWLGVKHEVTWCNSNGWLGVKHEVTWCNSNGWLGVKHEVTYLLTAFRDGLLQRDPDHQLRVHRHPSIVLRQLRHRQLLQLRGWQHGQHWCGCLAGSECRQGLHAAHSQGNLGSHWRGSGARRPPYRLVEN